MRLMLLTPLLLLGACQVSKDDANDSVTVAYNEDVAANAAADVTNTAEQVATDISNNVEKAGDTVANKVDNVNVDVDVNTKGDAKPVTNSN